MKKIESLDTEFWTMFFKGKTWKGKEIYSANDCQNK